MGWGIRSNGATLGLLTGLLLACSPFTATTPAKGSPEDGGATDGGGGGGRDGGPTGDADATPPPSETFCSTHHTARWCFDFESGGFGTWQGTRWTDNLQQPGTLVLDDRAALSTVPGWTTDDQAGRANVFLDASFTSTLGFEWSFTAEQMGNGSYALIAEILEDPSLSGRVTVYAIGDNIRFEGAANEELVTISKPPSYPARFRLDLRRSNGDVLLDVTVGGERRKTSILISPWSSAKTRVGFGIGQVDETRADPDGRRFRYDDILVETD